VQLQLLGRLLIDARIPVGDNFVLQLLCDVALRVVDRCSNVLLL
jgi:hypothetical protein